MKKKPNGITIFNCYRRVRNSVELELELSEEFVREISELTQEQIDDMVKMAKELNQDDDMEDEDNIPY